MINEQGKDMQGDEQIDWVSKSWN